MNVMEQLYQEHHQDLYRYLFSLTRDKVLAEDLLSETFLNAIHSFPSFKGDSSIKTWLYSIARHCWMRELRKKRPLISIEDLMEDYLITSLEDYADQRHFLDCALKKMEALPEQTQKVIRLRAEGFSYHEIAKTIGIQENSARVIEFRGKNQLRTLLKKENFI